MFITENYKRRNKRRITQNSSSLKQQLFTVKTIFSVYKDLYVDYILFYNFETLPIDYYTTIFPCL